MLDVAISDIPVGAVLTDGTNSFTATSGNTTANVTGWDLTRLNITAPLNFAGSFDLTVTSTSTESSNGDAASTTAIIPVTVLPINDAPTIVSGSVNVSEEGLTGGLLDASGTPVDTTDSATQTGSISISDPDSTVSVTLSGPAGITSNGVAITWSGDGTAGNPLIGNAGDTEVMRVTIDSAGNYSVTLSAPIDHDAGNGENIKAIDLNVVATDGELTTTGTLTVNVEDDAPNAVAATNTVVLPAVDTNVMLMLDISGSMGQNGGERLTIMKQAVNEMLDQYDNLGDVMVRVVTFNSGASAYQSNWVTVDAAKAYVNGLTANGNTNYDAALLMGMDAFDDPGKIAGAQNVSYFLTDGQPTVSYDWNNAGYTGFLPNQTGIQPSEEAIWTNFLTTNSIKSYAYGMGTGATLSAMNPVAYDGTTATNTNAIVVADINELPPILRDSIVIPTTGNITSGTLGAGSGLGADGGYMETLTIDGVEYAYDGSVIGTSAGTYNGTTHVWSIQTVDGGKFEVDMDTGDYDYTPSAASGVAYSEDIAYTLIDQDGDRASSILTIDVQPPVVVDLATESGANTGTTYTGGAASEKIIGTDGDDVIHGGDGDDIIRGGAGNDLIGGDGGDDVLSGGLGADVFEWTLGDAGTSGAPTVDQITDFDSSSVAAGGDALDLRDLLQGELHTGNDAGNLSDFLHFEQSNGNTIVHVSSNGGFSGGYAAGQEDATIVLNNVDLFAGGLSSDQQVITDLLSKGKLITD